MSPTMIKLRGKDHPFNTKNTEVWQSDDKRHTVVYLHGTAVVKLQGTLLTLRTGGYATSTTKTRMNEALRWLNLPFYVFQKKHVWYVEANNGKSVVTFTTREATFDTDPEPLRAAVREVLGR
jgi:hypothetical protein